MVDKNLMSVKQVVQVDDSDMMYAVKGGTTDGRVSVGQLRDTVAKTVNGEVGDITLKAGTNVSIETTGVGEITINSELSVVKTPTAISPLTGDIDISVTPTLVGSAYGQLYGVPRLHREFQVDLISGDFSSPVVSFQVDSDSWMVDPAILDNTDFKWRCRDVDTDGEVSGWSEAQSFTTIDIYIQAPSPVYPLTGEQNFPTNGELSASVYQIVNSTQPRQYREFQIDVAGGDFSSPIKSVQVNADDWDVSPDLSASTDLKWRCRDVSGDFVSEWSLEQEFRTFDVLIQTPTITKPTQGGNLVNRDDPVESSPYQTVNSSETHVASYWEFYDNTGLLTHSSGRTTTSLTSYQPPLGVTIDGQVASVRVRYEGSGGLLSEWSMLVSFTGVGAGAGKYLAVAHTTEPCVTIYGVDVDDFNKLANPSVLPTGESYGVAFSQDGTYMAVSQMFHPRVAIYKRSGDTFTKLADPSVLPGNISYCVTFSPDGTYMSVGHANHPYISIYKRSGDTFTKLANPSVLPADSGRGVAFSPDGIHMAVVHNGSPFVTIYKRSGDTFTKLANPSVLPAGFGRGVAFSPDGTHMAVAHDVSPFITIYKREGDTFTKLANPSVLPAGNGNGVAFSQDGTHMAVAHNTSPFITIYKRSGDTFTKLTNPSVLPTGNSLGVAFSGDGTHVAVAHNTSPFITIYKRSGDALTKLANPSVLPAGNGLGVAFWPSAIYPST